jgi:hypothetical protein
MDGYSEKKFEVNKKILLLLISVVAFLLFAYASSEISWMQDIVLFIELISSILSLFIAILALVRYYTRKDRLNLLMIGIGFLFVGVLELVQLFSSVTTFQELFTYSGVTIFPLTMILSQTFLSILLFISWFVRKDIDNPDIKKERLIYLVIIFLFVILISVFLLLVNGLDGMQDYLPALIGGILSTIIFTFSIIGYLRSRTWVYDSFEYWLIFSLVFLLTSSIFFLPLFNLEYDLLIKFSVFAKFGAYIFILVGFLVSIYEMYLREISYLEDLKLKNEQIITSKNAVEEAYMTLREEKIKLRDSKDEN